MSFNVHNYMLRLLLLDRPFTKEEDGAIKFMVSLIREEAFEDAAKLFDGCTYGPYVHPSKAIRALKRPTGDDQ